MANSITYADLDRLLRREGFTLSGPPSSRSYYRHSASSVEVTLPPRPPDDAARAIHVAVVRRTLVENGIIGDEAFDRWLYEVRFGADRGEPVGAVRGERRAQVGN